MKFKNYSAILVAISLCGSSASAALVVHYKLDDAGGGTLSNANSGSSGHGWSSSTGATLTTGKFGGAGAFTTSSQWWSNQSVGADLSSFTLSMHIRSSTAIDWQDYASIGDGNSSSFRLEHNGGSQSVSVYTDGSPGGGNVTIAGNSTVVNDGSWHHLSMVSNGSTIELFVDGASAGSDVYTGSGAVDAFQLVAAFGAGRNQNADIDDVAIYDSALSSGQINWLSSNEAVSNVVPEPSSTVLLCLGTVTLLGRRRRM